MIFNWFQYDLVVLCEIQKDIYYAFGGVDGTVSKSERDCYAEQVYAELRGWA